MKSLKIVFNLEAVEAVFSDVIFMPDVFHTLKHQLYQQI